MSDPTPLRGRDGFKRYRCRWPLCGNLEWDRYPAMHLCQSCALHVWSVIDRDMRSGLVVTKPEAKPARQQRSGWIYYLRIGSHIKVGFARDLISRLAAYPPNLELLAVHPGTMDDEQSLHAQFAAYCVAGREWYSEAREILLHIEAMRSKHGEPDPWLTARRQKGRPEPAAKRRRSNRGSARRT